MSKNSNAQDVKFSDLFRGVEFHDDKVNPNISVPDTFYQRLQDFFMERSYLNDSSSRKFASLEEEYGPIHWLRLAQLPVNPANDADYDLLGRWQSVLATMHAWNYRLLFLLLRQEGETRIYLGTTVPLEAQGVSATDAVEQLRVAATGNMPGTGIETVTDAKEIYKQILGPLSKMTDVGAVTGIPSFRSGQVEKNLQTLDSLAFGIRDQNGLDRNYALLVVADPIQDTEIAGLISRMRELGSKIHSDVSRTANMQRSAADGKSQSVGAAVGGSLGHMASSLLYMLPKLGEVAQAGSMLAAMAAPEVAIPLSILLNVGGSALGAMKEKKISYTSSGSVNVEYLDKFAQAAEELTNKHVERYKAGRSLGFWNAGVYVMGSAADIRTVTGMLRSIYSGQESYIEPIRTHLFSRDSGAKNIAGNFKLLPLVAPEVLAEQRKLGIQNESWHLFGKSYQYLSTPVNTAELSLLTSLPHRDAPGLRFVKTAVRFASNPMSSDGDTITLGKVVDMGVTQGVNYRIDPNLLVRHALITGVTGSGKSTTCKNILQELMSRNIPVLVIEPAKDDYVRWAVEMNKSLPPEKQISIYMPGDSFYPGAKPLELNLFEPAAIPGARVDMLQHSENMSMLLNACLPSEEVVPILIDETVYQTLEHFCGMYDPTDMELTDAYPTVKALLKVAGEVMEQKNYDSKVQGNLKEILETRFKYLMRGYRGKIFNVNKSLDYHELFARPAVINLSRLAGAKEKSLVMSLLLLALYEYRSSAYQNDENYRMQAQTNRLMHLTLVEEAHNVMAAVKDAKSGDPRVAAGDLFSNMLSEIRGYGEGIAIVDQVPTRLLPDAVKNTNLKICHRMVAPDDCEVIASSLALREDQKTMIPALEVGNAIVCGDMDDAAAWVRMTPPRKRG